MSSTNHIVLTSWAAVYLLFLLWWGGRGKPMTAQETAEGLQQLRSAMSGPLSLAHLHEVEQFMAQDDGREFIMTNAVLYRKQALYPENSGFGPSPREADQRYGKAIIWPLLKRACLPIFIARTAGQFVNDAHAPDWHYVAMVRYRSRRDFLNFALDIEKQGISVHKWAAIEQTQVFPVRPLVSGFSARLDMAVVCALLAWGTTQFFP
jgi:hypothetical protein